MRIAQVAPLFEAVPPERYGGTERVIAALCDGLMARGHDVVLYASRDSATRAELRPARVASLRARLTAEQARALAPGLHLELLEQVAAHRADHDVVHLHLDVDMIPCAMSLGVPIVVTTHGRLDLPVARSILAAHPDVGLVSISDAQRAPLVDLPLNWLATIRHGLDLGRYLAEPNRHRSYLAFVGRVTPEKGLETAITVAERLGMELRIAAKVDPADIEYYDTVIEPMLGPATRFVGELGEAEKPAFYAGAVATLFPSDWPEPFGLVMIESLAVGTPVIALRRGSVPEVLEHGRTGYIVDHPDDFVRAVTHVDALDPEACRQAVRSRFSVEQMCARYEEVYERVTSLSFASGPIRPERNDSSGGQGDRGAAAGRRA